MNLATASFSPQFHGHTPLWKAFWIYGVLLSHVYFGAILFLFNRVGPVLMFALLWGFIFYTLAIMRVIWVNTLNTQQALFTFAARYLTVIWMINSFVVTGYLYMTYFGYWKPLVNLP